MKNLRTTKLQLSSVFAVMAVLCALAGAFMLSPAAQAQGFKRLITQEVDESRRVTLHGNVHPLARPEFDRGAMSDSQPINRIYLLLSRSAEQQTALDKLMLEQMDSNSANFHKWLTPEEYGTKFGPSDEDVQAVKNWLNAHGFTGIKTNNGKTIVEFNGTVGSVRNAFSTEIHKFNVKGEEHFANVSDPQIPAALAPAVMGVVSLHNFRKRAHIKRFGTFRHDDLTGETRPLFTFTDVNGTFFGMGPADFATIYNIPSTINAQTPGTGQSIAIVARSNINTKDLADFRSMFGLAPLTVVNSLAGCTGATPQFCVILNGADPGTADAGEEGEADLDAEWSGAVAPGATIKLVVSESEQTDGVDGVDASAEFIVDNSIAPVMSESFGSCEVPGSSEDQFLNALWQQAAAEGITVSVSAGDNGSAACDDPNSANSATHGIAVSGTASTPFNVAIGGTDFDDANNQNAFWNSTNANTTQASAKGYIPEIPWNDSCAAATGLNGCTNATAQTGLTIVAGSGGPSKIYSKTQAPFQTGFGDGQRDIPDVSFFAADGLNKSFYIVCQSDQNIAGDAAAGCNLTKFVASSPFHDFQAVGGTSASAPAFAGVMALVNQKTGQRQGNANFVLYSMARSETFSNCNSSNFTNPATALPSTCVFIDVTKNNNAVPCVGGSPNCSKTTSGGNGVLQTSASAPAFASGTGYDLATGLGSINVTALLSSWAAPSAKGSSTTLTSPTTAVTTSVDSPVSFSGTVSSLTTGTPTGIVVLEDAVSAAPIDTAALNGSGAFSFTTTKLPGNSGTLYTVKIHYGGDGNFGPSDSSTVAVTSAKQSSQVVVSFVNSSNQLTTAAQSVAYGSPYILRVDVEGKVNGSFAMCENISTTATNYVCPTGSVSLLDNGAALKDFPNAQTPNATNQAQLNNRGFIEDQPIQLNAGAHSITATYAGDASYNAPTTPSNTLSITITQAATTTAVVSSPTVVATAGGAVTLTATISSNSNSSQGPTGTVQFQLNGTNVGAAATCTPKGATSTAGASCTATLQTTASLLPPLNFDNRFRRTPFEWLAALLAMLAIFHIIMTLRARGTRRTYTYAAIALFFVATAVLAGCSGPVNSGGGGGGSHTDSITAKYSGDTNYAASQGTGSVTVQ